MPSPLSPKTSFSFVSQSFNRIQSCRLPGRRKARQNSGQHGNEDSDDNQHRRKLDRETRHRDSNQLEERERQKQSHDPTSKTDSGGFNQKLDQNRPPSRSKRFP